MRLPCPSMQLRVGSQSGVEGSMEKGLVIVLTGEGKGKTTSALGMALRAAGQGLKVLWLQFLMGGGLRGEHKALERIQGVRVRSLGLTEPKEGSFGSERHREESRLGLEEVRKEMLSGNWHMLILDDVLLALHSGMVLEEELVKLIGEKPIELHMVLTGKGATSAILEVADTVTEMVSHGHHHAARGALGKESGC